MEVRRLGRSGLLVSRLGLGTMTWGRDTDEAEAAAQLAAFVAAGGTLLDTSPGYGDGAAEDVVGALLGRVVHRRDVVLAAGGVQPDASRRALLDTLDASLRRLGTDHVDLWQVPLRDAGVELAETLSALDRAVVSGRAHYAGVAGGAAWQVARAATYQEAWPGRAPVVAAQVEYSLLAREVEHEAVPAAAALGLGVLARSPLAHGVLTGKYRAGTPADSRLASAHLAAGVERFLDDHGRQVVEAVCTAADGLGVAPLEVALAWARDAPGVSAVVLGARTSAQLHAALGVEDVELPAQIRAVLDEVSARTCPTRGA